MKADIYLDHGVLVIDYKNHTYARDCELVNLVNTGFEVTVTYKRRNWLNIVHGETYVSHILSDVDPYDEETIKAALPQYVEYENGYWEKKLFKKRKYIVARKRLKAGWVQLQPSASKTVITSQYRIIN